MTSSVSSTSAVNSAYGVHSGQKAAAQPPQKPAKQQEDTVHLSAAAKAASDADHDGDSK